MMTSFVSYMNIDRFEVIELLMKYWVLWLMTNDDFNMKCVCLNVPVCMRADRDSSDWLYSYLSTQTIHNRSHSISNHYDLNMNCVSSVIIYHSIYHVFIIIQSLSSIQFIHSINTYSQHTLNYLHSLRDDIVMKIIKRDCLESVLMRCEEGVYWLIWCEDGVKI